MKTPDIETAVRFYYEKFELTSADIKQIFSCGGNQDVAARDSKHTVRLRNVGH